jgi:molecular chaperone HscB
MVIGQVSSHWSMVNSQSSSMVNFAAINFQPNSKHQTPNTQTPKHQNTKHQTPKHQTPNPKPQNSKLKTRMNYFQLFNIPVTLNPDKQLLKQKFYELSRKYHPDFFTQETEMEQAEALELSSQVNKAYKTLKSQNETIRYVLMQKGMLKEEEKYQLPPDFLMEVMELNEQLQDANLDGDAAKMADVKQGIAAMQDDIYRPVKTIIEGYDDTTTTKEELQPVKEYYFKKKYLDRILATIG